MIRGKNGRPYLIAEIGGNHEGNFETAKYLCNLAINTDVDSVKFQLYRGDSLVNKKLSPDRNRHFKKFELKNHQTRVEINLSVRKFLSEK